MESVRAVLGQSVRAVLGQSKEVTTTVWPLYDTTTCQAVELEQIKNDTTHVKNANPLLTLYTNVAVHTHKRCLDDPNADEILTTTHTNVDTAVPLQVKM